MDRGEQCGVCVCVWSRATDTDILCLNGLGHHQHEKDEGEKEEQKAVNHL